MAYMDESDLAWMRINSRNPRGGGGWLAGMTGLPGGSSAGSLTPAPARDYTPAHGGVPQVPDPLGSLSGVLTGNLANLAQLYNLAMGTSGASAAAARNQLASNLPGYEGMTGQSSANIASHLRGEIPLDVKRQLGQLAGERGIATGLGTGGPNTNAALLAALGKTSMGLQAEGEKELTGAVARTPTGPAFDPSRFLITPQQLYEAQLGANIYGSAPSPADAAAAAEAAAARGLGAGRGAAGGGVSGAFAPVPYGHAGPGSPWASDAPNAPAGGGTNLPAEAPAQDWYTRTFGSQQFGGGQPGGGSYYAGEMDAENYLDQLLGFAPWTEDWAGESTPAPAEPDYGTWPEQDWTTMGYDPLADLGL